MKSEIAAIDLYYLVNEFREFLGARIDRVCQPDLFYFQVHKSNIGKVIFCVAKNAIWITSKKPEMPKSVKGFCQLLRKYIEGKKITAIDQVEGERILRFVLETQKEKYLVFIELFAKGNIILANDRNIVLGALEERAWKDREIKKGKEYVLPPKKANILALSVSDFKSDSAVSKHLAQKGFGKLYALEVCVRAGVSPESGSSLSDAQKLFTAYRSLFSDSSGAHVYDGEIIPFALKDRTGEKYNSFNKAIDDNYSIKEQVSEKDYAFEKKSCQLKNAALIQEESAVRLEKESALLQRKGELIYEHYEALKCILEDLNRAGKKYSLQELKEKIKGHSVVKNIDPKTGDILIEIS